LLPETLHYSFSAQIPLTLIGSLCMSLVLFLHPKISCEPTYISVYLRHFYLNCNKRTKFAGYLTASHLYRGFPGQGKTTRGKRSLRWHNHRRMRNATFHPASNYATSFKDIQKI